VSWLRRLQELFASPCDRCGNATVIEREELVATIPAVFEVVAWCPRCGSTISRQRVVDCHP
jgi:ribosomal protein S27AE